MRAAPVQALAVALALAAAPAAAEQADRPGATPGEARSSDSPGLAPGPARGSRFALAVLLGPSFESQTAFRLSVEGSLVARRVTPEIAFAVALPVSVSFWSGDEVLAGSTTRTSSFRLEVVPVARFMFPLPLGFLAYADAGLGFSWWSKSAPAPFGASGAAGEFRLAAGATYALGEHFLVRLEPVGLGFYFGSGDGFVYSLMAGAAYRF